MKVTFCTREYDNLSGGQNTWLCRFLPDLARRGIESRVLCFTLSREGELPTVRSLHQAGIDCTTFSDEEKKYTEQRVRWLLEQLAEDPPDVFVANMVIPAAYYAGRWLREAGIPTVGICHVGADHFLYPGLLDQFIFGRAAYHVSALVCVSKYLKQDILKRCPKGILVRSIHCGVPIPTDAAKKPNGRLRLAYVGRLAEEAKHISEVTHALCQAVREVPGTEAFIYGDGEERPAVERIIRKEFHGLPVRFVGRLENEQIPKQLLKCHAVVLLSDWEGLGLALLEGMACGLVPIGLRHARGGAPELIEDGVTGLLVDDRGDGFVAAVRRLRKDPELWQRLARSARATAEAEYSIEICAARWQELFHKLVNHNGPRKPLRIPRRLLLPPVHPALTPLDHRAPRFHQRLARRVRRFVERVRYQCPSIFVPLRRGVERGQCGLQHPGQGDPATDVCDQARHRRTEARHGRDEGRRSAMIQKTINAVILGTSVLIAVFWLLFVLLFFSGSLTFGAEPSLEEQLKQKDVYILRLEEKIAELQNRRTGKALD